MTSQYGGPMKSRHFINFVIPQISNNAKSTANGFPNKAKGPLISRRIKFYQILT